MNINNHNLCSLMTSAVLIGYNHIWVISEKGRAGTQATNTSEQRRFTKAKFKMNQRQIVKYNTHCYMYSIILLCMHLCTVSSS